MEWKKVAKSRGAEAGDRLEVGQQGGSWKITVTMTQLRWERGYGGREGRITLG